MTVSRYRLTKTGWLGAALFVLPTPIAAWHYNSALSAFASRSEYEKAKEAAAGIAATPELSPLLFTALATACLIGAVLLLVGRELDAGG